MKIKVLRSVFANGKLLEAGKSVEVAEEVAKELIAMGKAEVPVAKGGKADGSQGGEG